MRTRRPGQTTVEYMLTVSVVVIAIMAVIYTLTGVIYTESRTLGRSLSTSLTSDGVQ